MKVDRLVEHNGIIIRTDENSFKVRITDEISCSSCHCRSACFINDREEKTITIFDKLRKYNQGDKVKILSCSSLGTYAVFFTYLLPFLVLIVSFFISSIFIQSELAVGLISLSILLPYYCVLHLFKNQFNKKFEFKIKNN